jgi:hypothetical protein
VLAQLRYTLLRREQAYVETIVKCTLLQQEAMADRSNGHGGDHSYLGMGAQFEKHPSRHASIEARDLNDDLRQASRPSSAKATSADIDTIDNKDVKKRCNDDGFQSIDRARVGIHKGCYQEGSGSLPPMQRWRYEHADPWNNIGMMEKKLDVDDGKKVSGARRCQKSILSTAAARGSLDINPRR